MKNILNKLYFHPFFLIVLFIFTLIGKFKFILYFMMLIIVHEIGHISVALIFKWKIDKVIILPFGGLTKFNELINRPLIEEFFVSISGIIFQLIFFKVISSKVGYSYFSFINYFIIVFNMLPIYPLDGSKFLNVILNKITSFRKSLIIIVIFSYIMIIILALLFFNINKLIISILLFLLQSVNKLYKQKDLIFNKFLLERYINKFNFKKEKIINNINNMKKDYRHIFFIDGKYLTETTFLTKYFDISIEKKSKIN